MVSILKFKMKAIIKDRKEIAEGSLWVKFQLSKEIDFKPGQYFFITIFNPPYHDGKGSIRHFSFVNSPMKRGVVEMATRLTGSAFKKSLQEVPIGTEVDIDLIRGDFILPKETSKPLVFLAGGIGITPFMSMLRFLKEQKHSAKITLIYSNRDRASTAFLKELQDLASKSWFKLVLTMTEDPKWKGEKGRVDNKFLEKYVVDLKNSIFYVAGPSAMTEAVVSVLKELKVDSSRIKSENFTGY